jgi:hypothetical protein
MNTDVLTGSQVDAPIKRKRGFIREDGMVFWAMKSSDEIWLSPEQFLRFKESARNTYLKNAEKIKAKLKAKYEADPEKYKAKARYYGVVRKEAIAKHQKEYVAKNKDRVIAYRKQYYQKNKASINAKNLAYSKANPEIRKKANLNHRLRMSALTKFGIRTRNLIKESLRRDGMKKGSKTEKILGCTIAFFKEWISSQFLQGMSFENHGRWHIDHYIPMSFAKNEQQALALNHYTNLRPLWGSDNLKKKDTIPEDIVDKWNELCKRVGLEP